MAGERTFLPPLCPGCGKPMGLSRIVPASAGLCGSFKLTAVRTAEFWLTEAKERWVKEPEPWIHKSAPQRCALTEMQGKGIRKQKRPRSLGPPRSWLEAVRPRCSFPWPRLALYPYPQPALCLCRLEAVGAEAYQPRVPGPPSEC